MNLCGILGWMNSKKDLRDYKEQLDRMLTTLIYRGPDEGEYYFGTGIALGHRRLIVVDPDGGKQPMTIRQGDFTYTLVYNGEIYNTEEVRRQLKSKGHIFNSYSDTEVVLRSYLTWGTQCVEYLNGIFAFGIWEERERTLFLARDRLGVKPLFYTYREGDLKFASEIKGLLANDEVEAIIDEDGLTELLGVGPGRSLGKTVFKNIKEIKPGEWMLYTFKDNKFTSHKYWSLKAKEHRDNEVQTIEHIRHLVTTAVQRQLVADVPICTFLSGGLDSSIISAIASNSLGLEGKALRTYSLDYEENRKFFKGTTFQKDLDHHWVDLMVDSCRSVHKNITLKIDDLISSLEVSVEAMDLPGMADIDSSLFLFCKEVRRDSTVALSGECADEIFGGYPWFRDDQPLNTFPWSRFVAERKRLLNPEVAHLNIEAYVQNQYDETLKNCSVSDKPDIARYQKLTYLNIRWFMMTLLNRKDRMSMANSLEVRVPFADHPLVEYTYNVPPCIKDIGNQEKGLLRHAFKDLLPEEVTWRKKNPYPKTYHPRYLELIKKRMKRILEDQDAPIHQIINPFVLKEIVDSGGDAYTKPWYGQLMTGPQLIAYFYQLNYWMYAYDVKIQL